MTKCRHGSEVGVTGSFRTQQQICFVTRLGAELQLAQHSAKTRAREHGTVALGGQQEKIVGISKIVNLRKLFDGAIQFCKVNVGEQASAGATVRNPSRRLVEPGLVLVHKLNALAQQVKQIVVRL